MEAPELPEVEGADKTFSKRVALTTAVYAVVLAVASLGGNHATKEMLLAQQQSSDQWAFYQAKVIREHQYRAQKMRLEVELAERGPVMKPEARDRYEKLLKKFGEEEKRYNAEKKGIENEAKKLEHERDLNRKRDPNFLYAEVLLQIAIVVASVSILATSRPMYLLSFLFAFGGALLALNGYFLFVPLFH